MRQVFMVCVLLTGVLLVGCNLQPIINQVVPAAPSGLTVQTQSSTSVQLTWQDNSSNETGFKIERSTSETSEFVQVTLTVANQVTFTDTGLNPATTYYYRVKALNTMGESAYSNIANATTSNNTNVTLPAAPANLAALAQSQSEIKLTWSDLSDNETGFRVFRSTISTGGFVQIQQLGSNLATYTDTGLNPGTTYYYQLKAYNEAGESAATNTVQATTLNPALNPPATPGNLTGVALSQSEIRLNWSDLSDNETGFRVYRSNAATDSYTLVQQLGSNVTTFTNSGLNAGCSYFYKITTFNNDGESAPTNWIEVATLPAPPVAPAAPGSLTAQAISETGVELTWADHSNNESGFRVYRSTVTTGGFQPVGETIANDTNYTDNGLTAGTQYYYLVVAFNEAGESSFSNMADALTLCSTAIFRIYNNTRYAIISLQIDTGYGLVELINDVYNVVPAGTYKDLEYTITGGSAVISYYMEVGFYDQYNGKNPRFNFWGDSTLLPGQTTEVQLDISLAQVLSNFREYSDWEGTYWSNGLPGYKTFRIYANGRWELYNNGYLEDSGSQVILVQWNQYSDFIYFKFEETGEVIEYYYPYFTFYYSNGPADWSVIEYVLQVF